MATRMQLSGFKFCSCSTKTVKSLISPNNAVCSQRLRPSPFGIPRTGPKFSATRNQSQVRDDVSPAAPEQRKEPFVTAGLRLERLVANTGDGEQEFLEQLVAEEGTDFKLIVTMLYGSLMLLGSVLISMTCHGDPWGGMSFSLHSLSAAMIGFLLGVPLAALKLWSWSPYAESVLPSLEDLHQRKMERAQQWLSGLTVSQVATVMLAESFPPLFLLFPTAQAALGVSLELYSSMLGPNQLLLAIPDDVVAGLSLSAVSAVCGVAARMELAITTAEMDVIQSAVANSDRFYRLTATDSAQSSSEAFKAVATAWVRSREDACNAGTAEAMGTVMLLGVLWHVTGDLAAPLTAALLVNGVEYFSVHRRASRTRRNGRQQ